MGFGCNGVHQFHMVSLPSRMDLLLISSHQGPSCHKKNITLPNSFGLRPKGYSTTYIHPYYFSIKDVNSLEVKDHHNRALTSDHSLRQEMSDARWL